MKDPKLEFIVFYAREQGPDVWAVLTKEYVADSYKKHPAEVQATVEAAIQRIDRAATRPLFYQVWLLINGKPQWPLSEPQELKKEAL